MGLPIGRSIIGAHGHRRWAAKSEPRGACFVLPIFVLSVFVLSIQAPSE
jgi:hypothetical protein